MPIRKLENDLLAERGVDESVRMVPFGQSSIKTVRRYGHATPKAMQEATGRPGQRAGDVLEFKLKAEQSSPTLRHPAEKEKAG